MQQPVLTLPCDCSCAAGPSSPYNNWGAFSDRTGSFPEPNQLTGAENCVMANYTMSSNRTPSEPGPWGWADASCESLLISICEIPRELGSIRCCPCKLCTVVCPVPAADAADTGAAADTDAAALRTAAAPNAFTFTSNITEQTYILNTSFVSQADAEHQCACQGGHLVSWTSLEEQQQVGTCPVHQLQVLGHSSSPRGLVAALCTLVSRLLAAPTPQVEAYYLDMGWLLPTFHKKYWLGLNATTLASSSPAVRVAGQLQTTPAAFAWLDKTAPIPYGQAYQHWGRIGSALEPNNLFGSENCGVGNASAAYALAWGWADLSCKVSAPFICKTQREQQAQCRGYALAGAGLSTCVQRPLVPDDC